MSSTSLEISQVLSKARDMAPAGYAIGLQIEYTTPKFMFQTYSREWLTYYDKQGLLMSDPTLGWGFDNTGFIRWDDLRPVDQFGLLDKAAEFGIKYGITCARECRGNRAGIRSIGSFARSDRDFTDAEAEELHAAFAELHDGTEDQAQLSPETVQQLRNMSIMVTHPGA